MSRDVRREQPGGALPPRDFNWGSRRTGDVRESGDARQGRDSWSSGGSSGNGGSAPAAGRAWAVRACA
jgi:hypothetical protein